MRADGLTWLFSHSSWTTARGPVTRAVGQYRRRWALVKVGLTTAPRARLYKHKADGWDGVVVVFQSSRRKPANRREEIQTAERDVIEHLERVGANHLNLRAGGAGRPSGGWS